MLQADIKHDVIFNIPCVIRLFAISDEFITVILTEKWLAAAQYVKVFCVVYMLELIQIGNINAIKALGRSDLILKMEVIKKVTYAIIIVLFVVFSESPLLLACSAILCNIVATIVNTYPNKKLIDYGYLDLFKDIIPNLINATVMCIVVMLVQRLSLNVYLMLVLKIFVGVIVYAFMVIITKNKSFKYLMNTIKQMFKK